MPSYIELDKQASFPASSDVSKVILGINDNNVLQITNSDGQSANASPTYKVYTALLIQFGTSNILGIQSGALVIGVTYTINDYISGDDFTNVGAPLNQTGVSFVATGTIPNDWSGASELIYDEGAPVVKVLENTIGNIWWTYTNPGIYSANSSGLFTTDKTYMDCKNIFGNQWDKNIFEDYEESGFPNYVTIKNYNILLSATEDGMDVSRIEIRVYN